MEEPMFRAMLSVTAVALAALAGRPALAATPPQYQVTIISLPQPTQNAASIDSYPLSINQNNRVVGYSNASGSMLPMNWKDGVDRPMTGPIFDRTFSAGVNNLGRVVGGGYILDSTGQIVESHALKWTGGQITDLGTLGGNNAVALAINNQNDTVVGFSTLPGETVIKAFRYANGHMNAIETLPGATESYPYDISDNGFIVGAAVTGGTAKPFRIRQGTVEALSMPDGARTGSANAINNIGAAVGTYEIDLVAGSHAAVLWRASGERVDLGNLGGSVDYAVAKDINNLGQVVGTSLDANDAYSGFMWYQGQLFNLNDFLIDGTNVHILSANSINDHGVIAAAAVVNGVQTTVLLSPILPGVPAPGSLGVLTFGAIFAFRRRR
jgi:probable HAF family extracellular repeat protein